MECETKAKVGSYYMDGGGNLSKIIRINLVRNDMADSHGCTYNLKGIYDRTGKKTVFDLDLTKEYDKNGNLLIDHNIDISKIPTVEEQKKFTKELNDKLNNPLLKQEGGSHYKDMAIQPMEYILKNNIGYAEGNVIKYVSRWKSKNGIEDLKKALHVLQILIYEEENKWVYLKH